MALPTEHVVGTRAAIHDSCDRVVFDVEGSRWPAYSVEYQPAIVQDASGQPVHVPGETILYVVIHAPTKSPRPTVWLQGPAVTAVVDGGSSEGQSTFGVGTTGKHPFRVIGLDAHDKVPARIVLDVAH